MPSHRFTIEIRAQVDTDDPTRSRDACAHTTVEAIRTAIEYAEDEGFVHPLANEVSIRVYSVRQTGRN